MMQPSAQGLRRPTLNGIALTGEAPTVTIGVGAFIFATGPGNTATGEQERQTT